MDSITIYPKDDKQKSLLKSLLEEMKVKFDIVHIEDQSFFTEKEFFAKVDKSIAQAASGEVKTVSQHEQRKYLGL